MRKKTIALIYGGYSSEAEVSVRSGKNVARNIDRKLYTLYEILFSRESWSVMIEGRSPIEVDRADFSFLLDGKRIRFDKVMIMIHGDPGENGLLQAYFDLLSIPYVGCSSITSTLTFDKYASKTYLRDTNVKMAKDVFLRKGDSYSVKEIVAKLGLPIFVKPNDGGSSFGITKVKSLDALDEAIKLAFREGETVLIEEFIQGVEMTNGVFSSKGKLNILPVTEIISDNEFFDYQAKYLGASREICPAEIPNSLKNEIQKITKLIYHHFGCRGVVRVDYIVREGEVYFLEINAIPGMTEASLVPQQLRSAGIEMRDFLTMLIEDKVV